MRNLTLFVTGLGLALSPPAPGQPAGPAADGPLLAALWAPAALAEGIECLAADHLGRVWACARRGGGTEVVVLADTDGDGQGDRRSTVHRWQEAFRAGGLAVVPGTDGDPTRVYIARGSQLLLLTDGDGDGEADSVEAVLPRAAPQDPDLAGPALGPDGKLYFSLRPPAKSENNATGGAGGSVGRCGLDGKNLELIATGFRDPSPPCLDSFGNIFVTDRGEKGPPRLFQVMPGGVHGRGGQGHSDSPAELLVYEGGLLPKEYRGSLLVADGAPTLGVHTPGAGGGSVASRRLSLPGPDAFRPSAFTVGPDGALLVAGANGAIRRVANGRLDLPPVDWKTVAGVATALDSPCQAVRAAAVVRLGVMDRGDAIDALETAVLRKDNPTLRARALWQFGRLGNLRFVAQAFFDPAPRIRITAMQALHDFHDNTPADYTERWRDKLLTDPAPEVRREALVLLRNVPPADSAKLITELARTWDGQDRRFLAAIDIALGRDKGRRESILQVLRETDAELARRLEANTPATVPPVTAGETDRRPPQSNR